MLLPILLLLQAPAADAPPKHILVGRLFLGCVLSKAEEWEPSGEPAQIVVKTSMGACSDWRTNAEEVQAEANPDVLSAPPERRKAVVGAVMKVLDQTVEARAYQAVLTARASRASPKASARAPSGQ